MSSMKNQNKAQPVLNRFNEEGSSLDSLSRQDKNQLVDFFILLMEWDVEEKEKDKLQENSKASKTCRH